MASKNINVLLSLVDKFTSPLKRPIERTKDMERQIKKSSNAISSFGKGANSRFRSIAGGITKLAAGFSGLSAILSVGALKAYADQSIEAARKQTEAETKLATILQNVESIKSRGPNAWKDSLDALTSYAGELQTLGVVGDEVTLSGMQQLATFQLNEQQIKMLSNGMLDLLVQQKGLNATQEDAVGIANMIGKAMTGNVGALSRVGITMSEAEKEAIKHGDAMQRAAVIAKVLQNNVGGVNKALAETDDGKHAQFLNAYGDIMEEMGKKFAKTRAKISASLMKTLPYITVTLDNVFEKITGKLDVFADWIENNSDTLAKDLGIVLNAVVDGITLLAEAIQFLMDHATILVPILAGVVAGFTAFNIITSIVGLIESFKAAVAGTQLTMMAFNAVMAANPAVLIAMGIAALIAVLVLLAMNWDVVKGKVIDFGNTCWQYINSAIDWCYGLGSAIYDTFTSAFGGVSNTVVTILQGITDFIVGVFTGNWDMAISGLVTVFKTYFSIIQSIADTVLGGISAAINSIGNGIAQAKEWVFGGTNEKHHATGTSYFGGGSTYVNEGNRGELITLPNGSQILPHDKTVEKLASNKTTINITLNVQGNVIGNEDFYNQCGAFIADKIMLSLDNM